MVRIEPVALGNLISFFRKVRLLIALLVDHLPRASKIVEHGLQVLIGLHSWLLPSLVGVRLPGDPLMKTILLFCVMLIAGCSGQLQITHGPANNIAEPEMAIGKQVGKFSYGGRIHEIKIDGVDYLVVDTSSSGVCIIPKLPRGEAP